jgi:hypothetical protein
MGAPTRKIGLTNNPTVGYHSTMNKKQIAEVMRYLGQQKSPAKARASRENGKLGGRPVGSKDSKPRKRRKS